MTESEGLIHRSWTPISSINNKRNQGILYSTNTDIDNQRMNRASSVCDRPFTPQRLDDQRSTDMIKNIIQPQNSFRNSNSGGGNGATGNGNSGQSSYYQVISSKILSNEKSGLNSAQNTRRIQKSRNLNNSFNDGRAVTAAKIGLVNLNSLIEDMNPRNQSTIRSCSSSLFKWNQALSKKPQGHSQYRPFEYNKTTSSGFMKDSRDYDNEENKPTGGTGSSAGGTSGGYSRVASRQQVHGNMNKNDSFTRDKTSEMLQSRRGMVIIGGSGDSTSGGGISNTSGGIATGGYDLQISLAMQKLIEENEALKRRIMILEEVNNKLLIVCEHEDLLPRNELHSIYQSMYVEDYKKEINDLKNQIKALKIKNSENHNTIFALTKEIKSLKGIILNYRNMIIEKGIHNNTITEPKDRDNELKKPILDKYMEAETSLSNDEEDIIAKRSDVYIELNTYEKHNSIIRVYEGYKGHEVCKGQEGYEGHKKQEGYKGIEGHKGIEGYKGIQGYKGIEVPKRQECQKILEEYKSVIEGYKGLKGNECHKGHERGEESGITSTGIVNLLEDIVYETCKIMECGLSRLVILSEKFKGILFRKGNGSAGGLSGNGSNGGSTVGNGENILNEKFSIGNNEYSFVSKKLIPNANEVLLNDVETLDQMKKFYKRKGQVISCPIFSHVSKGVIWCVLQISDPISITESSGEFIFEKRKKFGVKEEAMINHVSRIISFMIDTLIYQDKLSKLRLKNLEFINIVKDLCCDTSLQDLLYSIKLKLPLHLGYQYTEMFFYDSQEKSFYSYDTQKESNGKFTNPNSYKYPIKFGIIGYCFMHDIDILWFEDPVKNKHYKCEIDNINDIPNMKNMVVCLLKDQEGQKIGIIQLINKKMNSKPIGNHEEILKQVLRLLSSLVTHAAKISKTIGLTYALKTTMSKIQSNMVLEQ